MLIRIGAAACCTLLFIEILHSIYFNTKVAFNFAHYKSAVFRELDYTYFNDWLVSVKNEYPDYEILATAPGEDGYYMYTTSFFGGKGLYDGKKLQEELPIVKKKSLLLVMLYDDELPFYNSFISNKNVRFIHHIAYSNFFIVKLFP